MRRSSSHHLDDAPAGQVRQHACAANRPPGSPRCRAAPMPSASTMRRHGRGRAHRHAVAGRARHARLGLHEVVRASSSPALHILAELARRRCPSRCRWPRNLPFSIGPPETHDRRQVAARRAHQQRRRGLVAAAPAARRRRSDWRGSIPRRPCWRGCGTASPSAACCVSPSDITGNSSGKPPASQTPRFTCSASSRKCALQGVSSDQVLQMPMTGRPSNTSAGRPWFFIQLRCMKPSRSCAPNHAALRNACFFFVIVRHRFLLAMRGR